METYSNIEIIKLLQEKGTSLFTLADFGRLFNIDNPHTIYKKIKRLAKKGIVQQLIKGKYLFLLGEKPSDFLIANFLSQPSYVSLESALAFYGIISGFPYQITSITTKKTNKFVIFGKEYSYTQIVKSLFWGYEKKEEFLIAQREKSLLDYLYLSFKGLRSLDLEEFDLSSLNRRRFKSSLKMIKNKKFLRFVNKIKI